MTKFENEVLYLNILNIKSISSAGTVMGNISFNKFYVKFKEMNPYSELVFEKQPSLEYLEDLKLLKSLIAAKHFLT